MYLDMLYSQNMIEIMIKPLQFKKKYEVNKWKELIQSDPHQVPHNKGKDRQIQLSSYKMNKWQAELATFSQKTLLPKFS